MILSCGEISSDVYSESILSHEDFVIFEELLPISGEIIIDNVNFIRRNHSMF